MPAKRKSTASKSRSSSSKKKGSLSKKSASAISKMAAIHSSRIAMVLIMTFFSVFALITLFHLGKVGRMLYGFCSLIMGTFTIPLLLAGLALCFWTIWTGGKSPIHPRLWVGIGCAYIGWTLAAALPSIENEDCWIALARINEDASAILNGTASTYCGYTGAFLGGLLTNLFSVTGAWIFAAAFICLAITFIGWESLKMAIIQAHKSSKEKLKQAKIQKQLEQENPELAATSSNGSLLQKGKSLFSSKGNNQKNEPASEPAPAMQLQNVGFSESPNPAPSSAFGMLQSMDTVKVVAPPEASEPMVQPMLSEDIFAAEDLIEDAPASQAMIPDFSSEEPAAEPAKKGFSLMDGDALVKSLSLPGKKKKGSKNPSASDLFKKAGLLKNGGIQADGAGKKGASKPAKKAASSPSKGQSVPSGQEANTASGTASAQNTKPASNASARKKAAKDRVTPAGDTKGTSQTKPASKTEGTKPAQSAEDDGKNKKIDPYLKYKLPPQTLLNAPVPSKSAAANTQHAKEDGARLIAILNEFHVPAKLTEIHIGPSVTKFEIAPGTGVRVNTITNLQNDIKMALAATDIRIEAPIPGKSAVGIEVPNPQKSEVSMKPLMSAIPLNLSKLPLVFALGKDLLGNNVYGRLDTMPHLLIAGATGSGKSVCVNSIITSILMRTRPDEVKLVLIDPKKVEFAPYNGVPHLLAPVITDGEFANKALKLVVEMMDRRYDLFEEAAVRNITAYNAYADQHPESHFKRMPRIVVIIDELADLMLVAAKEVEQSIQRITQLARAAGIHLIVATQRPSVNVITGVIKANIPSRIAFAVSSSVDSRTILDQAGAERLLGYGDMLFLDNGDTAPRRIQGVFIKDEEVNRIADYVRSQADPIYDDAFITLKDIQSQGGEVQPEAADPLYDQVRSFVIQSGKASTSLIQRRFSIGYARAARLMDILEMNGIIGPANGSRPREILVSFNRDESDFIE